jgi:hypothetical protein
MKKEMLKGMEMPKKSADPMLDDEGLLEEDLAYDDMEGAEMDEMGDDLFADIEDADLIEEMKKRGLSLDEAPEEEADLDEEFEGELV